MPVIVTDTLTTTSSSDTYATHSANLGKGGYRSVSTVSDLNNIPTERREAGMLAYVVENDKIYQLASNLTTWDRFIPSDEESRDLIAAVSLIQVDDHDSDTNAHPALSQFITQQANRAEAAADIAQLNAQIYPDVNTGLSGVDEGQYFNVPSSDNDKFLTLYRNVLGTAVEIKNYPSSSKINDLGQIISNGFGTSALYTGDGDDIPIITDNQLTPILSVNKITGYLKGYGLLDVGNFDIMTTEHVNEYLNEKNQAAYIGEGPIVPVICDSSLNVLLGVNIDTGEIVGQFESPSVSTDTIDIYLNEKLQAAYIGEGPIVPVICDSSLNVLLGVNIDTGEIVGQVGLSMDDKQSIDVLLDHQIPNSNFRHLLFYGQSLSVGANAGSVLSTIQPYSNVTFNGGPRAWTGSAWDFSSLKPLVEDQISPAPDGGTNRKETICSGAANYTSLLLALDGKNPNDTVILCSTAGKGGSRIEQLQKDTPWYNNLLQHITNGYNLHSNYTINAFGFIQGESDADAATAYTTYKTQFENMQYNVEQDCRSITSTTDPVYMLTYQCSYKAKTHSDIALAQLDAALINNKIIMVTPTYHLPYTNDNTHLTAVGYKIMGAYFGRAYKQLISGIVPKYLKPVSATIIDNNIRIRFDPPKLPLIIDTVNLRPAQNHGFKVLVDGADALISNVVVDGANIVLTLSSAPVGETVVRYGLDYIGSGLTITGAGSGNIRDNTSDTVKINNSNVTLWHVSPAFQFTAYKLEI